MTDEQLSAILAALHSVELAVQDGVTAILQGPLSVETVEASLALEQYQELQQQLIVQQNVTVVLICFVALGVGVGLGHILARWFK